MGRTVKEESDLEQRQLVTKGKNERHLRQGTNDSYEQTKKRNKDTQIRCKRIMELGKTHFSEQRPKTFKEEIDKQRNTHLWVKEVSQGKHLEVEETRYIHSAILKC